VAHGLDEHLRRVVTALSAQPPELAGDEVDPVAVLAELASRDDAGAGLD
jgi:hypothetical protein